MLSPALSGRSQVISCHLRDVGIFIYGTDDDSEATRHGGLGCGSIPV
jgi:hypothetical protein